MGRVEQFTNKKSPAKPGFQRRGQTLANSTPARARTLDPRIKSPLLYQLSYRGGFKFTSNPNLMQKHFVSIR